MHIFLYQAARHSTSWGTRHRFKQNTKRGDFDLALLRKGIGGRYEILPHSEYPFQAALARMGMEEELYGHIVKIEEPKHAIWFKLNYDQVGRGSTKYVGGWRDLNPDDIEANIVEYRRLVEMQKAANSLYYSVNYQTSRTQDFLATCRRNTAGLSKLESAIENTEEYLNKIADEASKLRAEYESILALMADEQNKVREYMKGKKF